MKNQCPEWAAKIGVEVRTLTNELRCEPNYIASLLKRIDASEIARRRDNEGIAQLLVEQRRTADEYRVTEKVVQDLHKALAATSFDQVGRAVVTAQIASRTAELMRLGQQMLELDASVARASLRRVEAATMPYDYRGRAR